MLYEKFSILQMILNVLDVRRSVGINSVRDLYQLQVYKFMCKFVAKPYAHANVIFNLAFTGLKAILLEHDVSPTLSKTE